VSVSLIGKQRMLSSKDQVDKHTNVPNI
jgi:hypothetical protein